MKSLPKTIQFESHDLTVVDRDGHPWLTASDVAQAIGYKSEKSVSNVYNRFKGEFTGEMSEVISLVTSGNLTKSVRIFSPRGCHLIAMLARTEQAKAFRRWVLDVLDGMEISPDPEPAPALPASSVPVRLADARKKFVRRGNFVVEMENLMRATEEFPGFTSAELSVVIDCSRFDTARLVAQAAEDGKIIQDGVRDCRIGHVKAITWRVDARATKPKLPDYGFERFVRLCNLPSAKPGFFAEAERSDFPVALPV